MRETRELLLSLVIVSISALLSTLSFALNDTRTEWYMLETIYRVFGDVSVSFHGFIICGVLLYIIFWLYLSVSSYALLKFLGNARFTAILSAISTSFFLPHALLLPFALFSNYFIHLSAIIVFAMLIPFSLTPHALRNAADADFYQRSISVFLPLFLMLVLWTTFIEPLGVI